MHKCIEHYYYFYDLFVWYLREEVFLYLRAKVLAYCQKIKALLIAHGYEWKMHRGFFLCYCPELLSIKEALRACGGIDWYFGDLDYYQSQKQHLKASVAERIFILPWVLVSFFIQRKVALMLGSCIPNLQSPQPYTLIGIGHSMAEAFCFCPKNIPMPYLVQYIRYYFLGFDYYLALNKASKDCFEAIFQACKIQMRILPAGSLRLDQKLKEHKNWPKELQYFYFIPRSTNLQAIFQAISHLLKLGKKVILRPHKSIEYAAAYKQKDHPYAPFLALKEHPNFCFDTLAVISQELLFSSIVITDSSSVAYSTPLSVCIPTILFAPPKKEFDLQIQNFGHSFAHALLHRVALSVEECIKVALDLEQELRSKRAEIEASLCAYRQEEMYYLHNAKHALIEILCSIEQGRPPQQQAKETK